MDFSLSQDQQMLRDTAEKFVAREYPADSIAAVRIDAAAAKRRWSVLAELGMLALPFTEDLGGLGQGAVEVGLLMEAMGRAHAVDPYVSTVVLCGGLIAAAKPADAAAMIEVMGSGELKLAFAGSESGTRYGFTPLATTAAKEGAGYRLNGRKTGVMDGASADQLIVLAELAGAGPTLFRVDANAAGVTVAPHDTIDGRRDAVVTLAQVSVGADRILGAPGQALALIDEASDRLNAALCAEAAGAMEGAITLTIDYLKTRKQFGAPLASFQALQHRLVDMRMAWEKAKSLAAVAAMAVDAGDAAQRRRLVAAAKYMICETGKYVGQQAIQLHGAMGMTDECRAGIYAKRLLAIGQIFGDAHHSLMRYQASAAS